MEQNIYDILAKHFSGDKLSAPEEKVLKLWKQNPDNQEVLDEINKTWQVTDKFAFPKNPNIDDEWQAFNTLKEESTPTRLIKPRKVIWVAASIAVLFGVMGLALFKNHNSETIIYSDNKTKEVLLSDGSNVTLRKNSSIAYNKSFGNKHRNVTFTGEAFFEVSKNPDLAFSIKTKKNVITKVLGTSFNLKALQNENEVQLSVVTGKVLFGIENKETTSYTKNMQASINVNSEKIIKSNNTTGNTYAWKSKQLAFDNTPIHEVVKTCSDYFNIKIEIPQTLSNEVFSGKLSNPSLQELAGILDATFGMEHRFVKNNIVFTIMKD